MFVKTTDAKDAKNLRLEGGETIMVTLRGIEDVGSILLVDKDLSDSSIALDKGSPDDSITVVRFECDSPREPPGACDNGQFEVEIPEDIDKVSIKNRVRGASHDADDILDFYISKVRIK